MWGVWIRSVVGEWESETKIRQLSTEASAKLWSSPSSPTWWGWGMFGTILGAEKSFQHVLKHHQYNHNHHLPLLVLFKLTSLLLCPQVRRWKWPLPSPPWWTTTSRRWRWWVSTTRWSPILRCHWFRWSTLTPRWTFWNEAANSFFCSRWISYQDDRPVEEARDWSWSRHPDDDDHHISCW